MFTIIDNAPKPVSIPITRITALSFPPSFNFYKKNCTIIDTEPPATKVNTKNNPTSPIVMSPLEMDCTKDAVDPKTI